MSEIFDKESNVLNKNSAEPAAQEESDITVPAEGSEKKPDDKADKESKNSFLSFLKRNLYAFICFFDFIFLDLSFRFFYRNAVSVPYPNLSSVLFTVGWA